MTDSIQLVACTGAFETFWEDVAGRLEVRLDRADAPADATGGPGRLTILSCGGGEAHAPGWLTDALASGIVDPIVVVAEADHRLAVRLMRLGAGGFYALPHDAALLESDLADRVSRSSAEPPRPSAEHDFSRLIGDHPDFVAAIQHVSRVIPASTTTVLIQGETGTGKEVVARAIHDNSPRRHAPFVAVNCSAIPGSLLEAELFGHAKGAYTGATANRPGLAEAANGGTLFLDEISAMPVELQGKLLRFLQDRELRRLGEVRSRSVDVRVLSAANVDLRKAIAEGTFRSDLYYRLAVVPVTLPPLRERGDDVILLARHFLAAFATDYDVTTRTLTRDTEATLRAHSWPGNVRELRNAIERSILLSSGDAITSADLSLDSPGVPPAPAGGPLPFPSSLDRLEEAAATATLDLCDGNKSDAARRLGITRSRLYRLLRRAEGRGHA